MNAEENINSINSLPGLDIVARKLLVIADRHHEKFVDRREGDPCHWGAVGGGEGVHHLAGMGVKQGHSAAIRAAPN